MKRKEYKYLLHFWVFFGVPCTESSKVLSRPKYWRSLQSWRLEIPKDKIDLRYLFRVACFHHPQITIPNEDKEKRTQFHSHLKKYYSHLRSETKVNGEERKLEVFHPGKRQRERQWNNWGKDKPDFLIFTLYKENKETTAVLELIAKTIKVKSSIFDVAGEFSLQYEIKRV